MTKMSEKNSELVNYQKKSFVLSGRPLKSLYTVCDSQRYPQFRSYKSSMDLIIPENVEMDQSIKSQTNT